MEYPKLVRGKNIISIAEDDIIHPLIPGDVCNDVCVRTSGDFKSYAYYLSERCDWILGKDCDNMVILVPVKIRTSVDESQNCKKTWF